MATYILPNVKSDTSSLKAVPLPENRPRGSREERKERTRRRHALWTPEERGDWKDRKRRCSALEAAHEGAALARAAPRLAELGAAERGGQGHRRHRFGRGRQRRIVDLLVAAEVVVVVERPGPQLHVGAGREAGDARKGRGDCMTRVCPRHS